MTVPLTVLAWLLAALASPAPPPSRPAPVPHSWALAPGVTALGRGYVVTVRPGLDPSPVAAAVADLNAATGAGWTVAAREPSLRPGEVLVEPGPTSVCRNRPGADWGCTTHVVVQAGRVVWAEIDLGPVPPGELAWTLRHELGHAVGLDHVSTLDVMRPADPAAPPSFAVYQPGDIAGLRHLAG